MTKEVIMCLAVNKTIHKYAKPFIAKTDILVCKVLEEHRRFFKKDYHTPMIGAPVKFIDGQACLEIDGDLRIDDPVNNTVHLGIHAYTNFINFKLKNFKEHFAIIPKGTPYFIGSQQDIVSSKLYIFKNTKDYRKYLETGVTVLTVNDTVRTL